MCSDENDLDLMIFCSSALDKVLREFGSEEKIKEEERRSEKCVRDLILESAAKVGALRLLSHIEQLGLSFNDMRYKFNDNVSYCICIESTIRHVVSRSEKHGSECVKTIMEKVQAILDDEPRNRRLCCGHDCVRVLARALKRKLGSQNLDSEKGAQILEKSLRVAYDYSLFKKSDAFRKIREWEKRNGYKVLR